jgi:crotonobetainyl-CoA:carnitine CoA-transferase CaiB-like acyl-CoA transferase
MGLRRAGRTSANGTARLINTPDGWLVANLARPDDRDAVAAWIGCGLAEEPWAALAQAARLRTAADLAETGQALGIPAAVVGGRDDAQWRARGLDAPVGPRIVRKGQGSDCSARRRPVVLDLSALWAGPLCGHLLTQAGARVIKVESERRPDGARLGPPDFYDSLHAGQESVALDFTTAQGRVQLARLIARADLVIEGTRPRALEQLGVDLDAAFRANPALVWVSVTAFGRGGPWRNHVGFGDDAAAAGGLVARDADGAPVFIGDALADPVAGLMAASGALAALAAGGGFLVDVALREAAAFVADAPLIAGADGGWRFRSGGGAAAPRSPSYDRPPDRAPAMGEHTAAVLAEFA